MTDRDQGEALSPERRLEQIGLSLLGCSPNS